MATIQDIHALETRIYGIVQDYIGGIYGEDDVLSVSQDGGETALDAGAPDEIETGAGAELYTLAELVRADESGNPEPDNDRISDIANNWLFLD